MATTESLKKQITQNTSNLTPGTSIKALTNSPSIKAKFKEILDKRAEPFLTSVVTLVSGDNYLAKCNPKSVLGACMQAAVLNLPIEKNFGYAWVIPYKDKAQFQLGYKGYIQLALRSGQYKAINVVDIHEGELIKFNPLTEELEIDFTKRESNTVIGYAGYFKLLNGFEKTVYWSKEDITVHAQKFSKTYNKSNSVWKTDFDAMARKTVVRNLLSKWGILSIEMQQAFNSDMGIVKDEFIDEPNNESIVFETLDEDMVTEEVDAEIVPQQNFEGTPLE